MMIEGEARHVMYNEGKNENKQQKVCGRLILAPVPSCNNWVYIGRVQPLLLSAPLTVQGLG